MLVIIGETVDTVIRSSTGGSADMPQISTYAEVAESAAYADEKLTRQRASGRKNTTGEGKEWPRDWKLYKAKAAGKIWYAESRPNRQSAIPKIAVGNISSESRTQACQRLAEILRALAKLHTHKLDELRQDAGDLDRPDFVWRSLVESFSSMGNSRGYEGLFGDPRKYAKITFEVLSELPPSECLRVLSETLAAGLVRMPDRKAAWLFSNFEKIKRLGGPAAAKAALLAQPGRDAKIAFLETFDGIGPKYARNIFMNVWHPEFRESIAVDARIQSISDALGLEFSNYEAHERFYLEVAQAAGLNGWEVDRLIYWYKDEIFRRLGSKVGCAG